MVTGQTWIGTLVSTLEEERYQGQSYFFVCIDLLLRELIYKSRWL